MPVGCRLRRTAGLATTSPFDACVLPDIIESCSIVFERTLGSAVAQSQVTSTRDDMDLSITKQGPHPCLSLPLTQLAIAARILPRKRVFTYVSIARCFKGSPFLVTAP